MTLNEYHDAAIELAIYPDKDRVIYPTLGLTGEAGEVADKVKKILRDHKGVASPEHVAEIVKEMGDVLWYLAALARDLDTTLEVVAAINLEKLRSRRERNALGGNGDNR